MYVFENKRYRYDAEQRLICVEQDQGWQRLRSEYSYDPLGRRTGKRVYRNESEQAQSDVQFVWQGLRLLQEVEHGFGSVYVYADPDSYEPLARIDGKPGNEDIFYFHTNLAGLPEQLTDEAGLSVWHSEYEGWGKSRDEWHEQRVRREQNLRFQGQYLDRETGLHYNTFRFYDADVGRFTQPDPIGLLGGLNFYCYSPNPLTWADPLGLDWNYILRDSNGSPYYHGRASDNASLTDVARRHSKTKGIDGARFGPGDTINQITPKGTDRTIARGIEDIGSREKNVLGRKTGKVRGNVDPGVSDSNPKRQAYLAQAKAYLQSKGVIKPSLFSPIESKPHTSTKKSPTPTICGKKQ